MYTEKEQEMINISYQEMTNHIKKTIDSFFDKQEILDTIYDCFKEALIEHFDQIDDEFYEKIFQHLLDDKIDEFEVKFKRKGKK